MDQSENDQSFQRVIMGSEFLWKISVATSPEAEEPVAALLETIFRQAACIETDARTGATWASVYPGQRNHSRRDLLDQIKRGLKEIAGCGLRTGSKRITIQKIPRENWATSWKRHFKPIEIGPALLLKPDWSKRKPRKDQAVVVLNPGLSFGTGQHPTTYFCLEQLVAWRRAGAMQSCLDIGTGSGILAIAAVKLGYRPVEAFDADREAIRVARANARTNGVLRKMALVWRDLGKLSSNPRRQYDVVCANLTFDLLMAERERILRYLKTPGVLILAGLLRAQFPLVRNAYQKAGLKLAGSQSVKEWKSGVFLQAAA